MSVITLFPYQRNAVDAVHQAFSSGMRRPALAMPTGAGKTITLAQVIREVGQRALIIAHRKEIVEQNAAKARLILDDAHIGIVMADRNDANADVVSASIQTISKPERLRQLGTFGLVVADEAHHAIADSWLSVLDQLGAGPDGNVRLLGVSATWDRSDERGLDHVFDEIVYQVRIEELIAAGYLSDIKPYMVDVEEDFSDVRTVASGDFDQDDLSDHILHGGHYPHAIAMGLQAHGQGRHSLVFAPRIDVATAYRNAIRSVGMKAELIHGGTPKATREDTIAALRHGDIDAICNVGVFTEGVDVPIIDLIAMGRPTKSRALFQQMLGRGIRAYPGKTECIVLDFVNSVAMHEIQTVASLFGKTNDGESIRESIEREPREISKPSSLNPATVRIKAREVQLRGFTRSKLAWMEIEPDTFSIAAGNVQYLAVPQSHNAETYDVVAYSRDRGRQVIAQGLDIGYSQGIVEQLVLDSEFATMMKRSASWRKRDEPMTEGQRRMFSYLRQPVPDGITKAQASDLIARLQAQRNLANWKQTRKSMTHGN